MRVCQFGHPKGQSANGHDFDVIGKGDKLSAQGLSCFGRP